MIDEIEHQGPLCDGCTCGSGLAASGIAGEPDRAELVESVRGPGGGYRLARAASEIRVSEILGAVDETVSAMHKGAGASGGASGSRAQSLTNRLWEGLSANVYVFLHQTRLSDVVGNEMAPCPAVPALFEVVDDV